MPIFKSFDFGRTYINLDRVEQFSSHRDLFEPETSFIRMAGADRAITVDLPLNDLLFRLGIPVGPTAEAEANRRAREGAEIARRWECETLGVRDVDDMLRERRAAEREEQRAAAFEAQSRGRKPVQPERRVSASAARTVRE